MKMTWFLPLLAALAVAAPRGECRSGNDRDPQDAVSVQMDTRIAADHAAVQLKLDSLSTEAHRAWQDVNRAAGLHRLKNFYAHKLRFEPRRAMWYYLAGRLYPPNSDTARSLFRHAIALDPDYGWGYVGLASTLKSSSASARQAIALLKRAEKILRHGELADFKTDAYWTLMKADSLSTAMHRDFQDLLRDNALPWLRNAYGQKLTMLPHRAMWYYLNARLYRDNVDTMRLLLSKAIEVDSGYGWGYLGLASTLSGSRLTANEALRLLDRAERLLPNADIVQIQKAVAYETLGRLDKALEARRHALRLDPLNADNHAEYGRIVPNSDERIHHFKRAVQLDPSFASWTTKENQKHSFFYPLIRLGLFKSGDRLAQTSFFLLGVFVLLLGLALFIVRVGGSRIPMYVVVVSLVLFMGFLGLAVRLWVLCLLLCIPALLLGSYVSRRRFHPPHAMRLLLTSLIEFWFLLAVSITFWTRPGYRLWFGLILAILAGVLILLTIAQSHLLNIGKRVTTSRRWRRKFITSITLFLLIAFWAKFSVNVAGFRFLERNILFLAVGVSLSFSLSWIFLNEFAGTFRRKLPLALWYAALVTATVLVLKSWNMVGSTEPNFQKNFMYVFSGISSLWGLFLGAIWFWILLLATYLVLQSRFRLVQVSLAQLSCFRFWPYLTSLVRYRLIRYGTVGTLIVWIVLSLSESSLLEPLMTQERGIKLFFPYHSFERFKWDDARVTVHNLSAEKPDLEEFLRICDSLLPRLERAGVLFTAFGIDRESLRFRDTTCIELLKKLVRQHSIVLIVEPQRRTGEYWIDHPVLDQLGIPYVANTVREEPDGLIYYYRPGGFRHAQTGRPIPDAAQFIAARLAGDTIGRVIVPTTASGLSHLDFNISSNFMNFEKSFRITSLDDQRFLRSKDWLVGHAVILEWRYPADIESGKVTGPASLYSYLARYSLDHYAALVQGILWNKFIIPLDRWTPWTVGLSALICLLVFFRFPIRIALPMAAVMFLFLFAVSYLAAFFWSASLELVQPLLAIFICMIAFPILRLSDDRRSTELAQRKLEEAEKQRILEELRSAHDMQVGLMPTADPMIPGFDISGFSKPTEEVGGDYFDYLWMNEEKTRLGIAIADVSGKAMKAAITAVMTSGMIYREIGSNQSPKEILKKINTPMYLKTARNTFTAMSIAVIDTQTKTLTLSNAGQTHPILKRGKAANEETGKVNSDVMFLKVDGIRYPLGVVETAEYNELSVQLQSGDLLVFYTDGIVESTNAQRELYGFDRLEQKIGSLTNETAKQVIATIIADAEKFAGSQKQHDDMTAVVVRVL